MNMPSILVCILLLTTPFLTPGQTFGAEKIKIVATLFPTFDFARAIAGERGEVALLLPPGMEAHAFEPRPQDILRINEADIFIYTGRYMEPWVDDILRGVSNKKLLIVDAGKGIQLMPAAGARGFDPHIWLDFSNAQIMVSNILAGIIMKDPRNREIYAARALAYQRSLIDLDTKFRQTFSTCGRRAFITTGHAAFGYFARRYGLQQITPYRGSSPNAEPTPKMLDQLIRTVRSTKTPVVYYEELLSPKLAQTIADETQGAILPLSAGHNISKEDLASGVTFVSLMNENLENLKKGLQCR